MEDNIGAPFNMALFTLQKIHEILKNLWNISVSPEGIPDGLAQHLKYKMVKQLFIQSIPLFDKKDSNWKEDVKKYLLDLKKKIKYTPKTNSLGEHLGYIEAYNDELNEELDLLTIEIQEKLQSHGYFMPPKSDPRVGWKQG